MLDPVAFGGEVMLLLHIKFVWGTKAETSKELNSTQKEGKFGNCIISYKRCWMLHLRWRPSYLSICGTRRACLGECFKGQSAFFERLDPPTTEELQSMRVETEHLLENIILGGRKRLIRNWKNRSSRIKANIGELFRQFKPFDQVPLAVLKRSDGSLTGDVTEMDKILRENWMPIFAKHKANVHPEPDVQVFLNRFGHLIPEAKQELSTLTVDDLVHAVQKFATDGAGGLDGWKPLDLKRLTRSILRLLLHLFDVIESQGVWPDDLCWAGITLIPKGEGGMPLDLPP